LDGLFVSARSARQKRTVPSQGGASLPRSDVARHPKPVYSSTAVSDDGHPNIVLVSAAPVLTPPSGESNTMASKESDSKSNEPLDSVAELAANYNSSPNMQSSARDGVEVKPARSGPPRGPPRGPPPPEVLARKGMLALARNGAVLFCVIWATGCWIYGSNNSAQNHVNRLKVSGPFTPV
jgi:hypothetical protein